MWFPGRRFLLPGLSVTRQSRQSAIQVGRPQPFASIVYLIVLGAPPQQASQTFLPLSRAS